ncbi:DUF1643 domain-containing protein [Roseovarius tolerans]
MVAKLWVIDLLSGTVEIDRALGRNWELKPGVRGSAVFSECGNYRPYLSRRWDEGNMVMWLCMNPSSATNLVDDATSKKLTRHSRRLGYGGMFLLNVMDYRETDPLQIPADAECSDRNLGYIIRCAALSHTVVLAYGGLMGRRRWRNIAAAAVEACGDIQLRCVLRNANGSPRHPRGFPSQFQLQDFG